MAETTVKLSRGDGTPWGFRLGGGKDFGYPICIQRATPGSVAEQGGISTGDQVIRIGGRSTEHMTHQEAQTVILNSGNYLELTVVKGASMTWAPSVQPVGNIAPGSHGPVTKTSLAASQKPHAPIGSAHNTTAKPFSPQIVNKQYNCPAALYSMENIRDALEKQSEVLTGGAKGINFMKEEKPLNTDSAVYRMVHEEDKAPRRPPASPVPSSPLATSGIDTSPLQASGLRHVEPPRPPAEPAPQPGNVNVGGPNICAECGKLIVGVFCRIKDRNMHAECFRCATCGNSLKNQGYYLVGGKLYCDLHARNASVLLKEPVSPNTEFDFSRTSSQPIAISPVSPSPSFPSPTPPAPAPISPKPFGATPPSFRSVAPPVAPKPVLQRNSALFESSSTGTNVGMSRGVANFKWPPQDDRQRLISNAIQSFPLYRPPPGTQRSVNHSIHSFKQPADFGSSPKWPPQQNFQQTTTTSSTVSSGLNLGAGSRPAPRRGRGLLNQAGGRIPVCATCGTPIRGPFVSAVGKTWCPSHFNCANATCRRDLMDCGFVEENNLLYCECCFENYMAPTCSKCHLRIKGDCLNAIDRPWHPQCFTCSYCRKPFGNNSFYLEDGLPYCEKDWNELFTSKCFGCGYPIEAGDRWVEALSNNYHSTCFKCTVCHNPLEGQSFYAKAGKPYCRLHAR